ncbi:MAG: hypothetical protein PWQ06_1065 [Anaerophaga sp.]|nr:hypothetical protein [Anaerophaga sp.]MDN5290826.1 hypothetical protein [Anaerophaga sp.]
MRHTLTMNFTDNSALKNQTQRHDDAMFYYERVVIHANNPGREV